MAQYIELESTEIMSSESSFGTKEEEKNPLKPTTIENAMTNRGR